MLYKKINKIYEDIIYPNGDSTIGHNNKIEKTSIITYIFETITSSFTEIEEQNMKKELESLLSKKI